MSEAKFKGPTLRRWRSEGYEIQCFEDKLSGGIADSFIGWPGGGFWAEWKWVELPSKLTTPLPVEFQPGQIPWLTRFHGRPLPTCVIVGSPKGFLVVPGPHAQRLIDLPQREWVWVDDKPSISMVMNALRSRAK